MNEGVPERALGVLPLLEKSMVERNAQEISAIEGNIFVSSSGKKIKTVLITSSTPGEGKTTAAISMAASLAGNSGARVLLIDGNLGTPRLHTLFNYSASPGLSDIFLSKNVGREIYRTTEFGSLSLLTCGTKIKQYLKIFRAEAFGRLLESFKQEFDYVIFDAHSYMRSSEVAMLTKLFDGTVLVIEGEVTKWEVVQLVKNNIVDAGGTVLGAILNKRRFYIPRAFYD